MIQIFFVTLLISLAIICVMSIVLESIEIYYDAKERLRDED